MHLGAVALFLLSVRSLARDVRFEPFVKIMGANACIDDGHNDQDDGDHRKEGQRSPCRHVGLLACGRVHPDKFEEEVCKTSKVK